VERARDRVTLDRALGQVATHVTAVRVEHADRAALAREYDQLRSECLDLMGVAVTERVQQAQAVPTSGVALGQGTDINGAHLIRCRHFVSRPHVQQYKNTLQKCCPNG